MAQVVMIGATGLVGRSLAPLLVRTGHDLMILGRRPSGVVGAREVVAPLDAWPDRVAGESVDVAVSTLGSTIRKAGSWAAFAAIDRDAVLAFAKAARDAGARQFITISSVGADPASRTRYLALKGEVEQALAALDFERLDIVQPGLLRGARGADRRPAERLGIIVSPIVNLLLRGSLDRYAAIDASTVAAAIVALAGAGGQGVFRHRNREIRALAARAG